MTTGILSSFVGAIVFLVIAVLGPGIGLQRWLRLRLDSSLVLPLGWAAAALAYYLSIAVLPHWSFPVLIGLCCLSLAWPRRAFHLAPGPSLRGAVLPFVGLVTLLCLTAFHWNRPGPQGEFVLDPIVPFDTAFHVGLARELTIGYPPQVPGLAGFPLGYHLGADLVRAAALRWAGLDPFDTITRFETTIGALALVLLLRSIAERIGLVRLGVSLAPWTLMATDFSFLFGTNPQAHWWTDLLRGNLLLSLDRANPVVPALALSLGALLALSRFLDGEGRGWLCLAAGQALAVPFFKVFLGPHLLIGLTVVALTSHRFARGAALFVALPVILSTLLLAAGTGGQTVSVTFAPLDLVRTTRETLGLATLHGTKLIGWSALWLAASLGLRIVGVCPAVRALRPTSPLAAAVSAMALAGWPIGLLLRISASDVLPGQKVVNDAAFLIEQSGPLLWIFTAGAVGSFASRGRGRALAAAIAGLLALPTTVQFVVQKWHWPNDAIPASRVRAMRALEAASAPGEIVLQRPGGRFPAAPVVLISRRVLYERYTPWLTQFASREAIEARHRLIFRFFATSDRDEALRIARQMGTRFVCLYDGDRVWFEPSGAFVPIHQETGARVYRIDFSR